MSKSSTSMTNIRHQLSKWKSFIIYWLLHTNCSMTACISDKSPELRKDCLSEQVSNLHKAAVSRIMWIWTSIIFNVLDALIEKTLPKSLPFKTWVGKPPGIKLRPQRGRITSAEGTIGQDEINFFAIHRRQSAHGSTSPWEYSW